MTAQLAYAVIAALCGFLAYFCKRLVTQLDKVSDKLNDLDKRLFIVEHRDKDT